MPTSFLSRRDIESWVPDAAASKGSVGFVAKLSARISTAIASLRAVLLALQDDSSRMCQNELERFLLWCQGLSVADGHLDEILSPSNELHHQVLSLLLRLGTAVLQAISQAPGEPSQLQLDECDHLKTLLDAVETILQESGSDEHEGSDTPSEPDSSDSGLMEIMEEISAYVDCLLDLAPALDNPALDVQTKEPKGPHFGAKESFTTSCEEALIYCYKIRDRFDALPKYLVERPAEANVVRAAKIREMQRQAIVKETPVNDGNTESLFSGKDPQVTETTKSSILPSSVFSSVLASSSKLSTQPAPAPAPRRVSSAEFDDNASEATFASFSTAASSIAMGRPRIPPMPDVQEGGFDCTVCFVRLTDVATRKEWKRHVFGDLNPYTCTVEGCQNSESLYSHSREWVKHESSHSLPLSGSSQCVFCSATYQERGTAYFKHVSGHLREVSLSVLPQTAGDDESHTNDTDDSLLPHQGQGGDETHSSALTWAIPREPHTPNDFALDDGAHNQQPLASRTPQRSSQFTSTSAPVIYYQRVAERIIDQILKDMDPDLPPGDILYLCRQAGEIFLSQPALLELKAPLVICGDIQGQIEDLLRVFRATGFPPQTKYLFLGNYRSFKVISLLIAYKIRYPDNVFLLRGNYETALMARRYGFYQDCPHPLDAFTAMFNCMPLAAIVNDKVFCVHGGLSPRLNSKEDIKGVSRPTDEADFGIVCDLLWNDPDPDRMGWVGNNRGPYLQFGPDVVSRFLAKNNMDLIVRGHQVVEKGYQFSSNQQLLTLWTAPNWENSGNAGAILTIDENLVCSFRACLHLETPIKRPGKANLRGS